MKNVQTVIDKTAIGFSLICTMHCLLLPAAITLLPALAATSLQDEMFHRLLLIAVLPTSMIALVMGCRKHQSRSIVLIGLLGLGILTLTAFLGHDVLGTVGERIMTLSGSTLIAFGHFRNHALCRNMQCHR